MVTGPCITLKYVSEIGETKREVGMGDVSGVKTIEVVMEVMTIDSLLIISSSTLTFVSY